MYYVYLYKCIMLYNDGRVGGKANTFALPMMREWAYSPRPTRRCSTSVTSSSPVFAAAAAP